MSSFSPHFLRFPSLRLKQRRRLFVHAGLHKTGTTAVQQTFSAAGASLRAYGLFYPERGRCHKLDGQHNLAWQVTSDHRFDPARGTIDEAACEIGRFDGDAILSSEDFESILSEPARLMPLLRHRALRQHDIAVVVYLRNQPDYAESLYAEMLKHGLADDAATFCNAAMAEGAIRFRKWLFHFDYQVIALAFARTGGAKLTMRPYHGVGGGSTVNDLLHVTGRSNVLLPDTIRHHHVRETLLDSLARFCTHRLGVDLADARKRLADLLGTALDGRRAALSMARREAMRRRFAAGNRAVARLAKFPAALLDAPPPPAGSLDLEALFSERVLGAAAAGLEGDGGRLRAIVRDLPKAG